MKYNNWALNENIDDVKPVFADYKQYAAFFREKGIAFNLDLGGVECFINWAEYPESYSFWYYYVDCEAEVSRRFMNSDLINYDKIYVDFSGRDPICEISTKTFIEKWLDFVASIQFETTVTTEDGKLFMEFRKGDLLFSNFKI